MLMEKQNSFLTKDNIVLNLDAKSREDAIAQLSEVLYKNGIITDADKFTRDVLKRESMTTTGIGKHIAIPHGKSTAIKVPSMVFAKNKTPLKWNSFDGSKVTMIFLMAVSTNNGDKEHLKMLAHLSGKLMDDSFVSKLNKANKTKDILNLLED